MMRKAVAEGITRFRDRRRRFRRRVEEIFDRQTFVTLLVLGPFGKALELSMLGQTGDATKFAAIGVIGIGIGIYWTRLAAAASDVGDAVEDAVDPDD